MPTVLVATPLKSSLATGPHAFGDGVSIREVTPILWDISIARRYISEHEREELAQTRYWLCASQEYEYVYGDIGSELYEKTEHAASAVQIICPGGAKNVFFKFVQTDQGFDNVESKHPRELSHTRLGRRMSAEAQGLANNFETVYRGVQRSFSERIVRLQNPILLLEHAQQTSHVFLSMLIAVMGLDMLMMAGEHRPFIQRLGGFLGPDSRVFPVDMTGRQARVTIREIISNLFLLRNKIAHGQEIPETPYRRRYDVLDDAGLPINTTEFYYAELMLECSIFLLASALRKVFLEGLVEDVANESRWRSRLKVFEHRYREATRDSVP